MSGPLLVNKAKHQVTSTSPTNQIIYTPISAGNTLIALFNCGSSAVSTASIASTQNTWNTDFAFATGSGNARIAAFHADSISALADTITVTMNSTGGTSDLFIAEYSGLLSSGSFDVVSLINGAFSTALASHNATPTVAGDLAILFGGDAGSSVTYSSITGGFSLEDSQTGAPSAFWADQVLTGTPATSGGATVNTSTNWSAIVLCYKAGAASTPSQGLNTAAVSPGISCPF